MSYPFQYDKDLHVACLRVAQLVRLSIEPLVIRHTLSINGKATCIASACSLHSQDDHETIQGIFQRLRWNLETLTQLFMPFNIQSHGAIARGLLEICVDLRLLAYKQFPIKQMHAWELWAKWKAAKDMVTGNVAAPIQQRFAITHASIASQLKAQYSPKTSWSRWTGRNLYDDARAVDRGDEYRMFHAYMYWATHGSGTVLWRQTTTEYTAMMAKLFCFISLRYVQEACELIIPLCYQCTDLDVLCTECADQILDVRLRHIRHDFACINADLLKLPKQPYLNPLLQPYRSHLVYPIRVLYL